MQKTFYIEYRIHFFHRLHCLPTLSSSNSLESYLAICWLMASDTPVNRTASVPCTRTRGRFLKNRGTRFSTPFFNKKSRQSSFSFRKKILGIERPLRQQTARYTKQKMFQKILYSTYHENVLVGTYMVQYSTTISTDIYLL